MNALAAEALTACCGRRERPHPTRRRRAQVEATRNDFDTDLVAGDIADGDPKTTFLTLQSRVAEVQHPRHAWDRLEPGVLSSLSATAVGIVGAAPRWGRANSTGGRAVAADRG